MRGPLGRQGTPALAVLLAVALALLVALAPLTSAEEAPVKSAERIAEQAKAIWESGAPLAALELLEQAIQSEPEALVWHKLRGDILATFRGPKEAVQAYDLVLAAQPAALEVRWAKWSVLLWWGQDNEAIAELRRIAQIDPHDPLVHFRLAQDLRKIDRLEESLDSFKQAVQLMPDLLSWRLAWARAKFDVLDYSGAEAEVQAVLQRLPPGSPLEIPANNQLAQLYESMERGRRFTPVLTPGATAEQLKEWAEIRADAWKLFVAGRYRDAEPIYRKMLVLNPKDALATHQLGVTLMQLGRCEEALAVFGNMSNLDPSEEDYADTTYRMGQCLVELKRWEDAFLHFQTLYDAAVEFEEANKGIALPAGTKVLSKEKITRWLDKVRPHVPELATLQAEAEKAGGSSTKSMSSGEPSADAFYAKALAPVKPQRVLDTSAALMGRDADFSWFRFVIPAAKVVRDDFPTGAHDFIPLSPGDTFPSTQGEIYLVFRLVSESFDAVPLTARCVMETADSTAPPQIIAQDHVLTSMNDQSGYFMLSRPKTGWPIGLYRCGLFAGEHASAYTLADEVRFRIVKTR
ncbi:MAG TPA: tetratricopeptide repeat protein [Nitrospira sp.]|nr:tetratricopeptide repeat protein [Nitrospira sp.]